MRWLGRITTWFIAEYIAEYRESKNKVYELIIKNNLHLNTIILTVSIASLTALAALNDKVFTSYPWLSIIAVGSFILVILFSAINFFLSGIILGELQQKLNKDITFPIQISKGKYKPRFQKMQRYLSSLVLCGFCLGLISMLILLTLYILGAEK